ncbi:MAG: hypothetical protein KKB39_00320 [Nanoarchaeota archaeon]|nr:hypothetical protein [Nanoarchaeota archaeon]
MGFNPKALLSFNNKKNNENSTFEETVKGSFKKAREHMDEIEQELKAQKTLITAQNEQINNLIERIEALSSEVSQFKALKPANEASSSGNEGVFLHSYSTDSYSINGQKTSPNSDFCVKEPRFSVAKSFKNISELCIGLARQELLAFLTLFNIEEELTNVTYADIGKRMGISDGCVRTYISSLIKKGLPIMKKRFNNRVIYLSIFPEFRALNPKKELESFYYQYDPNQKRLIDSF